MSFQITRRSDDNIQIKWLSSYQTYQRMTTCHLHVFLDIKYPKLVNPGKIRISPEDFAWQTGLRLFSGLPQFCTIRFTVHNGWPLAFWVLTRNINLFGYYYFLLCFVTKCHKPLTCNNPESINHRTVAVSHFIWKRNKQWRWQIMRELNVVVQNEEFSLPL